MATLDVVLYNGQVTIRLRTSFSDWKHTAVPSQIRHSYSGSFSDIEGLPLDLLFMDFRPGWRYQSFLGTTVYDQALPLFCSGDTSAEPVILNRWQSRGIRTRFLARRGDFVHTWRVATR
jgi:hypothetical protein